MIDTRDEEAFMADSGEGKDGGDGGTLIVMPTYNEKDNLETTLSGIFSYCPQVNVLVVDDSSPDGTGDLAEEMAAADPRVFVIHRSIKRGLGPAYVAGFEWALLHGYQVICEMDMDGSHRPADLKRILDALEADPACDVVIGSRRVPGGGTENWPWYRDLISRCGSGYARHALGLATHDVTAGFRAYRSQALRRLHVDSIHANGYVFQVDMTRRVEYAGGQVTEVPILFVERTQGESKMGTGIVLEAMWRVTDWGIRRILGGKRKATADRLRDGQEAEKD